MRAARLHAAKDVRIEDIPVPSPGPDELLIRVRAVAICPSDWRLWESGDAGGAPLTAPIIQGHEFAGEVVETGTRVAIEPSWHCGHCDQCAKGRYNICRNVRFPSFPPVDGALAEYAAVPAVNAQPLPDNLSFIEGALAEPLGVAIHALRLCEPLPEERILVLGAGMIGVCALQLLRLRGCTRVEVIEPSAGRRRLAEGMGAKCVAVGGQSEPDVVLECSGYSGAVKEAMELAAPGGRIAVVGIPHPERVEFDANLPRRKELSLVFARRSRDTLAEAVALIATGQVDLTAIPVRRFPLEQAADAIALTGKRPGSVLRAIVEP